MNIECTVHGSYIASEIHHPDAILNASDVWGILNAMHNNILIPSLGDGAYEADARLLSLLRKWTDEIESEYNLETEE